MLAAAILLAANAWTATRSNGETERALLFAAFGAAGMPILQSPPLACTGTPAGHPARAEMLSLLAGDRPSAP